MGTVEEIITELEDKSKEITQKVALRDKELENRKEGLRSMEGRLRRSQNFPEVIKDMNSQIQKSQVPSKINKNKSTIRHIIVKLQIDPGWRMKMRHELNWFQGFWPESMEESQFCD